MTKPIILVAALLLGAQLTIAQLRVGITTGVGFNQFNDVRAPNGGAALGTFFSLTNDFKPQAVSPFVRGEISYTIIDRHDIQFAAVPLTVNYTSFKDQTISFSGETFTGNDITASYKFNTYRLSYRYNVLRKKKIRLGLGATVLLRDARIALTQGSRVAENTDLGAVPLISFNLVYSPIEKLSIILKGDALVTPQGRAEDIFLGITYDLIDALELKGGYRLIDGGSGVDQIYSYAMFHFAEVGLVYTFDFTKKDKK